MARNKEDFTTLNLPKTMKKRLEDLKVHPQQALYEVIDKLLKIKEESQEKKQ